MNLYNNLKPKVSVGVLCFNEEKYLKKLIYNLLNQSYENLEIIISDNNSNDGSQKIISNLKRQNPQLKVNFFKKNCGSLNNFLQVLKMSTGEYFFITSPGDELNKNFIKECMKIHLEKRRACVMCSTKLKSKKRFIRFIDFKKINNFNNLSSFKQSQLLRSTDSKIKNLKLNFFMLGIFKQSILKNVIDSFIEKNIPPDNERVILFCICMIGKLYHIDKVLFTKFENRKASLDEKFTHKRSNPSSIILNFRIISGLKNVYWLTKIKFSVIILNILLYKIKIHVFGILVKIRDSLRKVK